MSLLDDLKKLKQKLLGEENQPLSTLTQTSILGELQPKPKRTVLDDISDNIKRFLQPEEKPTEYSQATGRIQPSEPEKATNFFDQINRERELYEAFKSAGLIPTLSDVQEKARTRPFGVLTVEEKIKTRELPSSTMMMTSGYRGVPHNVETDLCKIEGSGTNTLICLWTSWNWLRFFIYVDGKKLQFWQYDYIQPEEFMTYFFVEHKTGIQDLYCLRHDTTNNEYSWLIGSKFPFNQSIRIRAYQSSGVEKVAMASIIASSTV